MAITRSFRVLGLYDVLTNLIPGAVLLLAVSIALGVSTGGQKTGIIIAIFAVLSFIAGHIVQAVASRWEGQPTLFGDTVAVARGEEDVSTSITITEVEKKFWPLCVRTFDLDEEFENYGKLIRLVLSHLETVSKTRALRFQAIHSFHRSMWAVSWLIVLIAVVIGVIKCSGLLEATTYLVLGGELVLGVIGGVVFGRRKEKFNKRFIEYLIADFYADRVSENKLSGVAG